MHSGSFAPEGYYGSNIENMGRVALAGLQFFENSRWTPVSMKIKVVPICSVGSIRTLRIFARDYSGVINTSQPEITSEDIIYRNDNFTQWGQLLTIDVPKEKIWDVVQNGIVLTTEPNPAPMSQAPGQTWTSYISAAMINQENRYDVEYAQGYINPTLLKPLDTLIKSPSISFSWTDNREGDEEVKETTVSVRPPHGEWKEYKVEPPTLKKYDIETPADILSESSFEWRLSIKSTIDRTQSKSETVEWITPKMSIGDMAPTGRVYKGFPITFRWQLVCDYPEVKQLSATIQYRMKDAADIYDVGSVRGAIYSLVDNGGTIPAGEFEWRVVCRTSTTIEVTSDWKSCTNKEISISISGLFPDANGRVPRNIINRFGWTFTADDKGAPGSVTQTSATLYWRPASQGQYKSVEVQGALQYVDIPAGTLPSKSNIEWYVTVRANTGTEATSATITVSTVDTASTPIAVSPAGSFLDDSLEGITFTWQHVNATGTAQTGYELSYSENSGASYQVLYAADGAASSWVSAPRTFSIGTVYWRVRTKNSDGDYGNYSVPAIFAIRRRPDAPAIVSFDQKPLPSIAWQSEVQTGYEIEVDGVSYGMIYGSTKAWRSPVLLEDGPHTVRVRIVNQYRDVSPWATVEINVLNVPRGEVQMEAEEQWAQVCFGWSLPEDFVTTCLLRDGELIAVVKAGFGTFTDRASVGSHAYVLRAFDTDGYYTDSLAVTAAPRVPYGAIGLLDGDDWVLLKCSPGLDRYSCNRAEQGSFVTLYGREAPEWRPSGSRMAVHSLTYAKKRGEDLQPLFDMAGKTVVYKDYEGHLAIGTFPSIVNSGGRIMRLELEITETWQEMLDYATV